MNYKNWSNQYYIQEVNLKNHIKKLKSIAKKSSASDANDINYRIALLYSMYLETKHIAKYLKGIERRGENGK